MKTLVAYVTEGGSGSVFMSHDKPYNTQERIVALMDYISNVYQGGRKVAITNLIPLAESEGEDG